MTAGSNPRSLEKEFIFLLQGDAQEATTRTVMCGKIMQVTLLGKKHALSRMSPVVLASASCKVFRWPWQHPCGASQGLPSASVPEACKVSLLSGKVPHLHFPKIQTASECCASTQKTLVAVDFTQKILFMKNMKNTYSKYEEQMIGAFPKISVH